MAITIEVANGDGNRRELISALNRDIHRPSGPFRSIWLENVDEAVANALAKAACVADGTVPPVDHTADSRLADAVLVSVRIVSV